METDENCVFAQKSDVKTYFYGIHVATSWPHVHLHTEYYTSFMLRFMKDGGSQGEAANVLPSLKSPEKQCSLIKQADYASCFLNSKLLSPQVTSPQG